MGLLSQLSSFLHSTQCPEARLARLFSHWCAQWYSPGHAQYGSGGTVFECEHFALFTLGVRLDIRAPNGRGYDTLSTS